MKIEGCKSRTFNRYLTLKLTKMDNLILELLEKLGASDERINVVMTNVNRMNYTAKTQILNSLKEELKNL